MRDIDYACKVFSVCFEVLTALHMVGLSSNCKSVFAFFLCLCMRASVCIATTISNMQTKAAFSQKSFRYSTP